MRAGGERCKASSTVNVSAAYVNRIHNVCADWVCSKVLPRPLNNYSKAVCQFLLNRPGLYARVHSLTQLHPQGRGAGGQARGRSGQVCLGIITYTLLYPCHSTTPALRPTTVHTQCPYTCVPLPLHPARLAPHNSPHSVFRSATTPHPTEIPIVYDRLRPSRISHSAGGGAASTQMVYGQHEHPRCDTVPVNPPSPTCSPDGV